MLANKSKRDVMVIRSREQSYEEQRTWFWFPLFSFFESSIDGKIPNEFGWPIAMSDITEAVQTLHEWIMSAINRSPTQDKVSEELKETKSSKRNGIKRKVKTK